MPIEKKDLIKFVSTESWIGIVVQVLIGLLLVFFFYLIARAVLKMDNVDDNNINAVKKKSVEVIDGVSDSSQLAIASFNTMLPFNKNYIPITHSLNIKGGAQFTYSLWINTANADDASVANKVIFMRGDKKKYAFSVKQNKIHGAQAVNKNDYMVFCPMLCFGRNKSEFTLKFNTINKIDETLYVSKLMSDNEAFRKNIMSILQQNWIMVTVVFEDNIPVNDFENGVRVSFYLNDMLYESSIFKGMLKPNNGNLYFFPDGSISGVRLTSMEFYNYALGLEEIQKRFQKKPNMDASKKIGATTYASIDPSVGNIIDAYNT